jgi:hypothetical protein
VAQVIVSPQAKRDVDEAISRLGLPTNTWSRIVRSLRVLETFPLAGPELAGRWAPARFVLGPWSWRPALHVVAQTPYAGFSVGLNHQEIEIRPGLRVSACMGAEEDHLRIGGSPDRRRPTSAINFSSDTGSR